MSSGEALARRLNGRRGRAEAMARMTIYQLASRLRLSIGTVSRALNDRGEVSAATRKRVLDAATRYRFTPSQSGRSLSRGATRTVAFMLEIDPAYGDLGEPFFVSLLVGLQEGLSARGIDLNVMMGPPGESQEQRLRRVVEGQSADAVVLAETRHRDPRIDYLCDAGFPFAALGRSKSGGGVFPSLDMDMAGAAIAAVERLVARGHRRIGVVLPLGDLTYAREWLAGYRRAMRAKGLPTPPDLIVRGHPGEAGGHAVTSRLLDLGVPPTAILYSNEYMTLGGYQALQERRVAIGADCAVIVASDSAVLRTLSPAVTGFATPTRALGVRLAEILLAAMPAHAGNGKPKAIREVWPMTLVPRASDGGPARR